MTRSCPADEIINSQNVAGERCHVNKWYTYIKVMWAVRILAHVAVCSPSSKCSKSAHSNRLKFAPLKKKKEKNRFVFQPGLYLLVFFSYSKLSIFFFPLYVDIAPILFFFFLQILLNSQLMKWFNEFVFLCTFCHEYNVSVSLDGSSGASLLCVLLTPESGEHLRNEYARNPVWHVCVVRDMVP